MKYKRALINAGAIAMMDIDTGNGVDLESYASYELEHLIYKDREYIVVAGTRNGGVRSYWEQFNLSGKMTLVVLNEQPKQTWHGVELPITSRSQVEDKMKLVVFHCVKGKMLCNKCSLKHSLTNPDAVAFYPDNILPYSQSCHECNLLVFNVWQSKKGGPLILFPKYVEPKK